MQVMKPAKPRPLATLAAVTTLAVASATARAQDTKSFEIYGFAQVDYIQDTKRLDPAWEDAFRPSKIATPEGQFGSNGQADVSAKQSRFGVKGTLPTGDNLPPVNFKFEFDMFGTGADAGQTTIRLRHFYGEWGQLLGGQTHTLFMDIDVFPNVIDYWGPPGMAFVRVPQIRWTPYTTSDSHFSVALERPSNDVDAGNVRLIDVYSEATVNPTERYPDLTAQYRKDGPWGHAQIAAILRNVGFDYKVNPTEPFQHGHDTGWGIDLTAAINTMEKDKVLLGVVYGHGIATYMNDGGMDLAPTSTPNPASTVPQLSGEAVPLTGVMAYYDHYWNSRFSSSIGYSFTQVSNTNFQDPGAFHKGDYASVNLLWYPVDAVMIGGELMWGKKTNNAGETGDDVRFQFSAKYNFGTKL